MKKKLSLNIIIYQIFFLYVCRHRSRVMEGNLGFHDWRKYPNYSHELDKTHNVDRTVKHYAFLTTKIALLELCSYIRMTFFEQHYVAYMHRQPASIIRVIKCEHQRLSSAVPGWTSESPLLWMIWRTQELITQSRVSDSRIYIQDFCFFQLSQLVQISSKIIMFFNIWSVGILQQSVKCCSCDLVCMSCSGYMRLL